MSNLTEKRKRFADEWLIDANATRAYKTAYPNVKKDSTAAQAGSRLLKDVKVRAYVAERSEEIRTAKTADAQEVREYLTAVMRGQKTEQTLQLIGGGEQTIADIEISARDRNKAAELLGKMYMLFTDNMKVTHGIEDLTPLAELLADE